MKKLINGLVEIYGISDIFPSDLKAFKEMEIQKILKLPIEEPGMKELLSINANVEIIHSYTEGALTGKSYEGQNLTGFKLMVNGKVNCKIEYTVDDPIQCIHITQISIPYSLCIALEDEFDLDSRYELAGYIEDIYIRQMDSNKILIGIVLLISAI